MRLEPVASPSLTRTLGLPALAIALTGLAATILAMIAGANPFAVLGLIVKGAAGSKFALLETLNRATPLIFTGLAVAVAFRAKLWNIGAEAQLYAGALITVVIGTQWGLPGVVAIPVMALGAVFAGALVLLGPVILKVRLGVGGLLLTAFAMQIGLIGVLAITNSAIAIAFLFLRMVPDSLSKPFIIARMQPLLADETRATYASLQSFAGRLLFAGTLMLSASVSSDEGQMPYEELRWVLAAYAALGLLALTALAVSMRRSAIGDAEA